MDLIAGVSKNSPMAKSAKPKQSKAPPRPQYKPTFLGPWIDYLGRKQTEIAEKVGMSESQLSLVINGRRQYIQDKLDRIAEELGIERGALFYPPPGTHTDWLSLEGLGDTERQAARNVVDGFKKKNS